MAIYWGMFSTFWLVISMTTLIDWCTCNIITRQMLQLGMFWKMVDLHWMLLLQGQADVKVRDSRTVHKLHFEEKLDVFQAKVVNEKGSRISISSFAVWRFSGLGKSSRWRWRSYTWCYDYGLVEDFVSWINPEGILWLVDAFQTT